MKWALLVAVLVAIAAALVVFKSAGKGSAGAGAADASPAKDAEEPRTALKLTAKEITTLQNLAMTRRLEVSGPLVAARTAVVRAKVAGTLQRLDIEEGRRVQAGQSLGLIHAEEVMLRHSERQAQLEAAKVRLNEAQRQWAAQEELSRQGFISPQALESQRSNLESAKANWNAAKAQLGSVEIGLKDAQLLSPISGMVGRKKVSLGEKLGAEQELFTVFDLSQMELPAVVPTEWLAWIKTGLPVSVRVDGFDKPFLAKVLRIAPTADVGQRGVTVVLGLPNPEQMLRAGQYANAVIEVPDAQLRTVVPMSAVSQASGQDYVWSVESGALVRRLVTVGRRDVEHQQLEILKGLAPEARILAHRFDGLREGTPVELLGS